MPEKAIHFFVNKLAIKVHRCNFDFNLGTSLGYWFGVRPGRKLGPFHFTFGLFAASQPHKEELLH